MDLFRIYVLWLSIFRIIWYINNTIHNSKIVHDTLIFSVLNSFPIKYIIPVLFRVFFVSVWYSTVTHNIYFTIWVYKNINIFIDTNIIMYYLVYSVVTIREKCSLLDSIILLIGQISIYIHILTHICLIKYQTCTFLELLYVIWFTTL